MVPRITDRNRVSYTHLQSQVNRLINRFSGQAIVFLLLLLAAITFLFNLGNGSLEDWDEAIYAQVAKEMIQQNDWLTLHYEDKPWFHKPPFYFWSTALFFHLFEVTEFWARVVPAISGIGTIILVYLIGKSIYDAWAGFLAALILLSSRDFVHSARTGMMDMTLVLFVFLSYYAYLYLREGNQKWWYVAWVSFALAFMTKSFAAVIIPVVIILMLIVDKRLTITVRSKHFWQGLLIACVLIAPWHILMYQKQGQAFIDEYFIYQIFRRSTRVLESNDGGVLYYVYALQHGFFPWMALIPFAIMIGFKDVPKTQPRSKILILIVLVVFSLYTLVRSKLAWYNLPAYPALAILTAWLIVMAYRFKNIFALTGLLIGVIAVFYGAVLLGSLLQILFLFAIFGLVVVLYGLIRKIHPSKLLVLLLCVLFLVTGFVHVTPLFQKDIEPAAKLARQALNYGSDTSGPLIVLSSTKELYAPTARFYSNRLVLPAQVEDLLERRDNVRHPIEIIASKRDILLLSEKYDIHVVAAADELVYAKLEPK